ncbi:MAG: hypothetical protein CLLPBCKN_008521 [Chroococcidiopsis cubana SAG 39.79]|jgi:hypothetical protein|uniref:hypothetical protein n=1 Tax=Chroococcidiopsis cubana TaxID=171392 RepID=UPI000D074189|nr:hypothetical protein [Chroococcidiopsis cubana]MDZ4879083.1 hypothetical protein [Chroococcidiopsis cubana SAG 39.79]PSB64064.1 hypothetical protein C7B79_11280 [Chroococcidiopsis cubana CCALA 043]
MATLRLPKKNTVTEQKNFIEKNRQKNNIEESKLFRQCDRLSVEKKAQLIKRLLSDGSIQVTISNSQTYVNAVCPLTPTNRKRIAGIVRAIANRMENR